MRLDFWLGLLGLIVMIRRRSAFVRGFGRYNGFSEGFNVSGSL